MTCLNVDIRRKTYGNGCSAIEHLAFGANSGEFIALMGPSGAGKTTLLNLVAGLDRVMDGSITFQPGSDSQVRPRTGFMFQEPRLLPWLTVLQNLALVLPACTAPRIPLPELLTRVGLERCGQLYPCQLSGGMQRRVALLRAFIVEPELLLMDEPFQSLDAPTAQQLRTLLQDLWQRRSPTVLFVTHSLREALSLADRVLFFSPRPARIILDVPIPLKGLRTIDDPSVQHLHASLLNQYPQLLGGCMGASKSPRQSVAR